MDIDNSLNEVIDRVVEEIISVCNRKDLPRTTKLVLVRHSVYYAIEKSKMNTCNTDFVRDEKIDFDAFVDFFNATTGGVFGGVRKPLGNTRKRMLNARVKERGKLALIEVIKTATESDFLKGDNKQGFVASLDWIIKPNNFEKILSGNYNRNGKNRQGSAQASGADQGLAENIMQGYNRGITES